MAAARRRHVHHARRGITRRFLQSRARGAGALAALAAVAGPGLLAGLSDDDPAGVTTYSILGTDFGYTLLWTVPLSTVLLIYFHLLGVRLGITTGRGFAAVIRWRFGARWSIAVAALLVVANIGTICAEFAGIAAAGTLAGIPPWVSAPAGGVLVAVLVVRWSLHRVEHVLLALSAVLTSYVLAGVLAKPDWSAVAHGLVQVDVPSSNAAMIAVTATLGTTLAPWGLAFIQSYAVDKGLGPSDWRAERFETILGSVLTGVIGVMIAVTCAAVLAPAGIHIEDAHDAAKALAPIAGSHAALLFGVGLLGASLLAAAIVPLSTAYSVAEGFGRHGNLDEPTGEDRLFYGTFLILVAVGAAVVSIPGVSLIQVIYLTQIVNAVLLPPQLVLLLHLNRSRRVAGEQRIGAVAMTIGIGAVGLVLGALVLLLLSSR